MSELTPTAFGVLVNLRERYQDSDPEVAMLLDAIEMLDEADRAHLL